MVLPVTDGDNEWKLTELLKFEKKHLSVSAWIRIRILTNDTKMLEEKKEAKARGKEARTRTANSARS